MSFGLTAKLNWKITRSMAAPSKASRCRLVCLALTLILACLGPAAPGLAAESSQDINCGKGGETLDLKAHVVKGKITLFDFYSLYCHPCMQLGPMLDQLAQKRNDLVVKKVDINRPDVKGIDWRSPLVKQYQIHSVPYFILYGPQGELMAEGEAAVNKVMGWLRDAGIL